MIKFPMEMQSHISYGLFVFASYVKLFRWKIESINYYHKKITHFFSKNLNPKGENRQRSYLISIEIHSKQTCSTLIIYFFFKFIEVKSSNVQPISLRCNSVKNWYYFVLVKLHHQLQNI